MLLVVARLTSFGDYVGICGGLVSGGGTKLLWILSISSG